jgi:UDP-2-acetamido-2-deoxy-ribo-hexuluronate aminotransferase
MNILLDNNIIIDILSPKRRVLFKKSGSIYKLVQESNEYNFYISSSSIDNIEYILMKELKEQLDLINKNILKIVHLAIEKLLKKILIAKTPSYIELDYDDIEDSQIIASAKAVNAKVVTRDVDMLKKYPDIAISPSDFLQQNKKNQIDFANLKKQYFMYQSELEQEIDKVLNNTSYIMGDAVTKLEKNLEKFTGAKYAITCSSGTDALLLAMMALDIQADDEIITTPFTFIATAETIAFLGAKPVFVDIDEKTYNIDVSKIEEKITSKTKAIMPVSLYGQPADIEAIQNIAKKHNLKVIIDGAQSFGSTYNGKTDSNLGDISTTSFFPAKPLGCFGDGGAVFTNNENLATKMKSLRVHGQSKRYHHKYIGMGGRMDTMQCAIVDVKLKYYKKDLALRQEVASKYTQALKDKDLILPFIDENTTSAFAQYSIRVKNRDELQAKLKEQGIPTAVHYPMPLHLQECFKHLGHKKGEFPISEIVSNEIMSLPMNPYVSDEEIEYIEGNLD